MMMTGRLPLTDPFLWQNFLDSHFTTRDPDEDLPSDTNSEAESDADFDDVTWGHLPAILLEQVFSYLSVRDRYHASMVCKHWYDVFFSPSLWRKLVVNHKEFTHQRYTQNQGYWTELSHHKVQMCLKKVGSFLHTVQVEPIQEFYNLYEFLRIWNAFIEFHMPDYPMCSLVSFSLTFCCETRDGEQIMVYGTGGKLLEELTRLLTNLKELEYLKLNNLLLDLLEAPGVLDCVVKNCVKTLEYLEIRNYTKELYPLFITSMFSNLKTLVVSPQQLNSYIVLRLADSKVRNLHIIQDHLCEETYSIDKETWKEVCEKSPSLSVYLSISGRSVFEINWQDGAPVTSVTYETKFSKVFAEPIDTICIMYNTTLKVYGHYGLPRYHGPRQFSLRGDEWLLGLVKTCQKLHTLVIRDRISTATLILLAREGRQLRRLHVRRNAIIKKCDWQRTITWDDDYYWTMRRASHSYEETFAEVSSQLGYKWEPLSDKEFRLLKPPLSQPDTMSDFDTS